MNRPCHLTWKISNRTVGFWLRYDVDVLFFGCALFNSRFFVASNVVKLVASPMTKKNNKQFEFMIYSLLTKRKISIPCSLITKKKNILSIIWPFDTFKLIWHSNQYLYCTHLTSFDALVICSYVSTVIEFQYKPVCNWIQVIPLSHSPPPDKLHTFFSFFFWISKLFGNFSVHLKWVQLHFIQTCNDLIVCDISIMCT